MPSKRKLKRKLKRLRKSRLARKLNTARADLRDMSDTVDEWIDVARELERERDLSNDAFVALQRQRQNEHAGALGAQAGLKDELEAVRAELQSAHNELGKRELTKPTFNHSRADGPFDPCPICLEQMDRASLLALVKDEAATNRRADLRERAIEAVQQERDNAYEATRDINKIANNLRAERDDARAELAAVREALGGDLNRPLAEIAADLRAQNKELLDRALQATYVADRVAAGLGFSQWKENHDQVINAAHRWRRFSRWLEKYIENVSREADAVPFDDTRQRTMNRGVLAMLREIANELKLGPTEVRATTTGTFYDLPFTQSDVAIIVECLLEFARGHLGDYYKRYTQIELVFHRIQQHGHLLAAFLSAMNHEVLPLLREVHVAETSSEIPPPPKTN